MYFFGWCKRIIILLKNISAFNISRDAKCLLPSSPSVITDGQMRKTEFTSTGIPGGFILLITSVKKCVLCTAAKVIQGYLSLAACDLWWLHECSASPGLPSGFALSLLTLSKMKNNIFVYNSILTTTNRLNFCLLNNQMHAVIVVCVSTMLHVDSK